MTDFPKAYTLVMMPVFRRWLGILLFSGGVAVLFYVYLHFSETGLFPSVSTNPGGFIIAALTGFIAGPLVHLANHALDRLIQWKKYFAGRFFCGLAVTAAMTAAVMIGAAAAATALFGSALFWDSYSLEDPDLLIKTVILTLSLSFLYQVSYALQYSYYHYASAQLESLRVERRQLELQFEALKGQVSPHYLFNSLNTISSLLFRDLPTAEQFIRRLAQTYQYILNTQDKKYVCLREEVEFVNSYYYLLRIRFQQQLNVEINLPPGIMNSRIPPLTLQMLVENAVKHNNLSGDKKVFVYITAQDNKYLKVINTKTEANVKASSFRVGLENIRKRYELLTDGVITIRDDDKFSVSLPVITNDAEAGQKFSA